MRAAAKDKRFYKQAFVLSGPCFAINPLLKPADKTWKKLRKGLIPHDIARHCVEIPTDSDDENGNKEDETKERRLNQPQHTLLAGLMSAQDIAKIPVRLRDFDDNFD